MRHTLKVKTSWVLFCLLMVFTEVAVLADDSLTMGVFPRRNSGVTIKMFKPLAKYLSQETGMKIKLETAKDFPAFWNSVKAKRYDIAHFNQLHYLMSKDIVGYKVFAKNEEFGKSNIAPAIAVRKDSGIETLQDLKGKNIIFGGGRLAMIAHVGNKNILNEAGLVPGSYNAMLAKNPPNAAMAVYYKKADAAGIGDVGLNIPMLKKKIDVEQMKFLTIGKSQPHIPWVYKTSLNADMQSKIDAAFIKLNKTDEGKAILKRAGMTGMDVATDSDYDISRAEMKKYRKNNKS